MLNVQSTLDPTIEALIENVIGCCITVHRSLGPGLLESVYVRALAIEFGVQGIAYEREPLIKVFYRGELLCTHRLDLIAGGAIVVEAKCVDRLHPVHHAQLLGYLRASRIRVGLLVNFNVPVLRDGLKRMIL